MGEINAQLFHLGKNSGAMHKFGDRLHAELFGEVDDAITNGHGCRVGIELLDQAAINFDQVDIQAQQVLEVGVTGPEVVNRDPAA